MFTIKQVASGTKTCMYSIYRLHSKLPRASQPQARNVATVSVTGPEEVQTAKKTTRAAQAGLPSSITSPWTSQAGPQCSISLTNRHNTSWPTPFFSVNCPNQTLSGAMREIKGEN